LALAAARAPSRAAWAQALAGGLVLGASLYLSFGLAAAGLIALAVVNSAATTATPTAATARTRSTPAQPSRARCTTTT
ncbi:hypothetical protein ACC848_45025, partial [Rhizobium johnstonii]